MRFLKLNPKLK